MLPLLMPAHKQERENSSASCHSLLAGIGLRHPHYRKILEEKPSISWLEVHSENFFMSGGPALKMLKLIRQDYSISLHGISLSLGSIEGVDLEHLKRLKNLIDLVEPCFVSDHLSWSHSAGQNLPDLLPLPYTEEAFAKIKENIEQAQEYLQRQILIENPSSYFEYIHSAYKEEEFLIKLIRETGAGILLDINNVYVSSWNHGWDPEAYIYSIPKGYVQEIHLSGHSTTVIDNVVLRIDDHSSSICNEVWDLYGLALDHLGPIPTLIEWDDCIPPLATLIKEAEKAQSISKAYSQSCYDHAG